MILTLIMQDVNMIISVNMILTLIMQDGWVLKIFCFWQLCRSYHTREVPATCVINNIVDLRTQLGSLGAVLVPTRKLEKAFAHPSHHPVTSALSSQRVCIIACLTVVCSQYESSKLHFFREDENWRDEVDGFWGLDIRLLHSSYVCIHSFASISLMDSYKYGFI